MKKGGNPWIKTAAPFGMYSELPGGKCVVGGKLWGGGEHVHNVEGKTRKKEKTSVGSLKIRIESRTEDWERRKRLLAWKEKKKSGVPSAAQ